MELAFLQQGPDLLHFIDVSGFFPALLVFVLGVIALRVTRETLDAIGEKIPTRRLQFKQLSVIIRFSLVGLVFILVATAILDLSGEGFSFFGGLILLGISFSSKDLIASLMAGLLLLFDRPFQVGDRITFGGHFGEVVEIGLRSVRKVDLEDNLISIPNNQFLKDPVSSANSGSLDQMTVFRFYIGCREDYESAEIIIREAVAASPYVYWRKPIKVWVKEAPIPDGAERMAIHLIAKAYVIDGRYESAFSSDVHKRVKRIFRLHEIRTAGELEWSEVSDSHAPS